MRPHRSWFVHWLLTMLIIQCRPSQGDSTTNVVGGTEDDNSYPAVVGLALFTKDSKGNFTANCTGTVVRDDLVMTAAHCLKRPAGTDILRATVYTKFNNIKVSDVSSSIFIVHPAYDPFALEREDHSTKFASDIAFIKFDEGALKSFAKAQIAPASPAVGDQVTLVGYGFTQMGPSDSNPEKKRYVGRNKISRIFPSYSNAIEISYGIFQGKNGQTGENPYGKAIAASGDSGGPLLDARGAVIGVASVSSAQNDDQPDKVSMYVNVNNPSTAAFLREHLASTYNKTPLPKSSPNVTSSPSYSQNNGVSYPYCSSNVSDPDRDGWGFENGDFCKILDASQSSLASAYNMPSMPADKTSSSVPSRDDGRWYDSYNGNSFPYCASNASDPDRDGWGYENGQSCKVRS